MTGLTLLPVVPLCNRKKITWTDKYHIPGAVASQHSWWDR